MIEHIEELAANLHSSRFGEVNPLREAHVEIDERRTKNGISPGVPERPVPSPASGRGGKTRGFVEEGELLPLPLAGEGWGEGSPGKGTLIQHNSSSAFITFVR